MIIVSNSYDKNFVDPQKSNSKDHGFGLKNIKNAVERNGGMMHIDKTDYFTVDILFSNIYSKE